MCYTQQDLKKLQRVMGYVLHTRHTGIVLLGTGDLEIKGYVDAGFGSHADGKSHTGLVIMIGAACVEFKSSKQKIVTKDSTTLTHYVYTYIVSAPNVTNVPRPSWWVP